MTSTPSRGVTPGLATNAGSFKATERAQAGVDLAPDPWTMSDEALAEMDTPRALTVTTANGVPFHVAVVEAGANYGRTGGLVADADMVEFYDARHAFDDVPGTSKRGQFVSRIYLTTLRGEDGYGHRFDPENPTGLDLASDVPSWSLDAVAMGEVQTWLDRRMPRASTPDPGAEQDFQDYPEEPPCCSICDGAGHGYPGGPPCPLEVGEVQRWETDEEERASIWMHGETVEGDLTW